jgi:peptidoglycan hydrolase CwlO-like protein
MNKTILPILTFLLISFSVAGQVNVPDTTTADSTKKFLVTDPSLKGQYRLLLARSKSYYGYKLINPGRLAAFYQSAADSIAKERAASKTARDRINEQAKTIDTLNNQIKASESSLASSARKSDDITFMGVSFAKSTYNTIVWSLIVVLASGLIFVISRSARNIHEAKYRTELYEEVSAEYQAYKTKANEKEKKLARELQDERNKLEDYKNKGL